MIVNKTLCKLSGVTRDAYMVITINILVGKKMIQMDIVIDLTPAQIGMFIAFSIAGIGIGMAMKRRAMRKKQRKVEQDVKEHDIKKDVEHQKPQPEQQDEHDVDALLRDLKDKSEDK